MGGSKGSFTPSRYPTRVPGYRTRVIGDGEARHLRRNAGARGTGAQCRAKEADVPAKTEKQRRFMGAELERKREGKKTRTGMSESELERMASKPKSHRKSSP
jgi:hypothetical protein